MFRWMWRALFFGWTLVAWVDAQAFEVPQTNRASTATHWAYRPLERPTVPVDRVGAAAVLRTPVDAFIQARLEAAGLPAAREAERATLLRRLSLDLTGLPPTPAEVAGFAADSRPDAYERQVERLLASPAFGERLAVAWLNWVRFAWPAGADADLRSGLMPYRDWVIAAFNANQPFDQFTTEQIAGDLLPEPTPSQRVATGFHQIRGHAPADTGQNPGDAASYEADRVRILSSVWLGVPWGCAACHDHPPFERRDFEGLKAFFSDLRPPVVSGDRRGPSESARDEGPATRILVESPPLQRHLTAALAEEKALYREASEALLRGPQQSRDTFRHWRQELNTFLEAFPDGWRIPSLVEATTIEDDATGGARALRSEVQIDGSIRLSMDEVSDDRLVFEFPEGWVAAVRLELLPVSPGRSAFRDDRRQTLVQLKASVQRKETNWVEALPFWFAETETGVAGPMADDGEVTGIAPGWRTPPKRAGLRQVSVWLLEEPRQFQAGDRLIIELPANALARLRLGISPLTPNRGRWSALTATIWTALGQDRGLWQPAVHEAFHRSAAWDPDLSRRLRRVDRWIRECRGGRAWACVANARSEQHPELADRKDGGGTGEAGRPAAEPSFPSCLPNPGRTVDPGAEGRSWNRLDLARWLTGPENPLTARCLANRLWKMFFGRGIVAEAEDLGDAGSLPSHPQLLDWLAAEFRQPTLVASPLGSVPPPHPWDVKHLVRLLVNSAAYRSASAPSPQAQEGDPENRQFSHQNQRPLAAVFVPDYPLALVDRLDLEIGGPWSLPPSLASEATEADRPSGEGGVDLAAWRRDLYRPGAWQNPAAIPGEFQATSAAACRAARGSVTATVEARKADHDTALRTASRGLALESLRASADDTARMAYLLQRIWLRKPVAAEIAEARDVLKNQQQVFASDPDAARTRLGTVAPSLPDGMRLETFAAWAETTRALLGGPEMMRLE